jgi:uncharacterized protein (DUF1697 family)
MPRFAAFLRAVNLGRNRRVSGAELRSLFEELGFEEVDAFRTSGNVVFGAGRQPVSELSARIEQGLGQALGYEVAVFLRTAAQVRAIADAEPFPPTLVDRSKGKLQVTLLRAKPPAHVREEVLALATDEDPLAFGDRELYWLPSGGTQESELDLKAIAELLDPTTMRTKAMIEQLAAKFFE